MDDKIFCEISAKQTHKNGQKWCHTLQRQQNRNAKLMKLRYRHKPMNQKEAKNLPRQK